MGRRDGGTAGRVAAAAFAILALTAPLGGQTALPALHPVALPAPLRSFDFKAGSMVWLSDSTLALTDMDAMQIVVAQVRGGNLQRFGRQGAGPGEFRTPMFMLARPTGELVIDDFFARRLSQFDANHRFVRAARSPGPTLRLVRWSGDVVRVVWVRFGPGAGGPIVTDVDLASGAATDLYRVFDRDSSIASPPVDARGAALVAIAPGRDGQIVVGDPRTYRLVIFDSGWTSQRRFGRPELKASFRTGAELDDEAARCAANSALFS